MVAIEQEDKKTTRVLTDPVQLMKCSQCGCEIDVDGLDAFLEIECPDCSFRQKVPARLGQFLLLDMIGAGGMGGVYIGQDESLGRNVAIKVMLCSLGENEEFLNFFKREAQAAARINHPNIAQIYSFGQEKGQPYIVMELIMGPRFDKLLEESKGGMDQALVMQVGADVADGLNAASEAGLLHGDVKPENILLDEKLQAKLVDFGIASFANQGAQEGIWGTPYYIAPEKLKRQNPDQRSDIYSLGATLYHAIAGRPPFDGSTPIEVVKARLDRDPTPLGKVRKNVNPNVQRIIMRMLHANPSMRYPTYPSLISDLRKTVDELGGRKRALSAIRKTGRLAISKKTTGQQPSATSDQELPEGDSPSASSKPVETKKLVFHKKSSTVSAAPKKPVLSTAGSKAKTATPANQAKTKPAAGGKGIKTTLVLILILIVLGAIGGTAFYMINQREKLYERKREYLALNAAKKEVNIAYGNVTLITSNLVKLGTQIAGAASTASNAVFTVLGVKLELPPPALPIPDSGVDASPSASNAAPKSVPAPATKSSKAKEVPDASAGAEASESQPARKKEQTAKPAVKEPAKEQDEPEKPKAPMKTRLFGKGKSTPAQSPDEENKSSPPSEPEKPKVFVDAQGRESPFGFDEMPGKKAAPAEEAEPKPAEKPKNEVPAEPAEAPKPADTPKIQALPAEVPELVKLGKNILLHVRTVSDKISAAKAVQEEALKRHDDAIARGIDSVSVSNVAASIMELAESIRPSEKEVIATISLLKDNVKNIDAARITFEKERDERIKNEQAAEKQKKDEEARIKREEELKALAQTELALVKGGRDLALAAIKSNRFSEAEKAFKEQLATLKTDEAKKLVQIYIDRCARLNALLKFLIEQINASPFKWGWTQEGGSLDINGASEKGLTVRGREVPWADVKSKQLALIIDHYLKKAKIPLKSLSEQNLNAAVYCFENDWAKAAETFKAAAIEQTPSLANEAERLMPKAE